MLIKSQNLLFENHYRSLPYNFILFLQGRNIFQSINFVHVVVVYVFFQRVQLFSERTSISHQKVGKKLS